MSPRRSDPDLELRSRVPADCDGSTLLDYLLRRFRYHDRAAWLREIGEGRLTLDGKVLAADARLAGGARLTYRRTHVEPEVDDRIVVLHDDDAVLVVQKPAHLPMHADGPFIRHTLIHLLQVRLALPELQLVHRLDRETSGLCVLAHSAAARDHLRRQFVAGSVHKTYLAVVRGRADADFTVLCAIGRSPSSSISLRRSAAADALEARPARTDFEVLRRGTHHSLLRCTPHTGRTHQIRVHLEAATKTVDGSPGRQLLHAAALAFDHPTRGGRAEFTDPMPADFEAWIDD